MSGVDLACTHSLGCGLPVQCTPKYIRLTTVSAYLGATSSLSRCDDHRSFFVHCPNPPSVSLGRLKGPLAYSKV